MTMMLAAQVANAQADQAPAQADQAANDGVQLEEIVVIASRRAESLQDVPVAVTAVTADTVEALGISDTYSLASVVPGLTFTRTSGAGIPVIRGVGSTNSAMGDESSVSLYVDGVYRPFRYGSVFSFNNIARVEVLKGPQGALFGRNATGGVIQVVTLDPSQATAVEADFGYGTYETLTGSLYATTGLAENLAADIAVYGSNQGEGYGENLSLGFDTLQTKELNLRSKWLWDLTDRTRATVAFDYNYYREETPYTLLPGSIGADGVTTNEGFFNVRSSYPNFIRYNNRGVSFTLEHEFDAFDISSVSSYQRLTGVFFPDNDASEAEILTASLANTGRAFTEELQLTSAAGSPLQWILGGFFMSSKAGYESVRLSGAAIGPAPAFVDIAAIQETTSYAVFGQAAYEILTGLTVTGALRYTQDKQEIPFTITSNPGVIAAGSQEAKFNKLTPRLVLDFQANDDTLLYASYNRGFKSGLFNTIAPTDAVVRPEVLDAYEVGAKLQLFDRRLRINGAAFFYKYKDLQLQQVVPAGVITVNAAAVESKGVDVDIDFAATSSLRLRAGFAYLDSEFTDFPDAPISSRNPAGGNIVVPGDAAGNVPGRAPKFQANAGAILDVTDNVAVNVNYNYNDGYFWEPDNRLKSPSYHLVNASIDWWNDTQTLGFTVWGRNLLDERYYAFVSGSALGDIASPAAPVTAGATLKLRM